MLNFILPILKNPLTRMIGQKVIGGIQHKIEKDKIIKVKEIEAIKSVNIEQITDVYDSEKDTHHNVYSNGCCRRVIESRRDSNNRYETPYVPMFPRFCNFVGVGHNTPEDRRQ